MTKWLTKEEQAMWRLWVEVTQRLFNEFEDDLQTVSGLTMSDYEILVALSESPDREARMNELADRAIISRSRLTYRVDRMVRKGFITRADSGEDRRGVVARLTDEGMHHLEDAAPKHVDKVQQLIFGQLDGHDVKTLKGMLDKLAGPLRD